MYPEHDTFILNHLIEEPRQGYLYWNIDQGQIRFSTRFQEILGLQNQGSLSQDHFIEMVVPEDRARAMRSFEKIRSGSLAAENIELRLKTRQHDSVRVLLRTKVLPDPKSASPRSVVSIIKKIQPPETFETSSVTPHVSGYDSTLSGPSPSEKNNYLMGLGAISLPALLIEPESRKILDANPAAEETFGYSAEEFRDIKIDHLSMEPQKTRQTLREAMKGSPCPKAMRWYQKRDGSPISIEVYIGMSNSQTLCLLCRDISQNLHDSSRQLRLTQSLKLLLNDLNQNISLEKSDLNQNPPSRAFCTYGITDLEEKMIGLIIRGYKNKEIAMEMHIAEITVKKHVSLIFQKTGVKNRADLSRFALEHQLSK